VALRQFYRHPITTSLSVSMSVRKHVSKTKFHHSSPNFRCTLIVAVVRPSSCRVAIRYLLPGIYSTLTAVGRSHLLARWPGTHFRILSGIQRAAQTVLGVYFKKSTCSRVTSASSALGVLSDYALYKSTHSLKWHPHPPFPSLPLLSFPLEVGSLNPAIGSG